MALKPHTRKQLINLAPEEMLFQYMDKIHLPECIKIEVWEQKNALSDNKKALMCNWNVDQFWGWYNQEDN